MTMVGSSDINLDLKIVTQALMIGRLTTDNDNEWAALEMEEKMTTMMTIVTDEIQ